MARILVRKNAPLVRYLAAALFGALPALLLRDTGFYPGWLVSAISLATAGIAIASPPVAGLVVVIALALPLAALDFVAGVALLVAGVAALQYLAIGPAAGFLLVGFGMVSLSLGIGAEWALAALGGYLLGRGRGAAAATSIAVAAIGAGLVSGLDVIGSVVAGGTGHGLLAGSGMPADPLGFAWFADAARTAEPGRLVDVISGIESPVHVALQPVVWAAAAVLAGSLATLKGRGWPFLSVLGGIALLAVGTLGLDIAFAGPLAPGGIATTAAVSLAVALIVVAVAETAFPRQVRAAASPTAPGSTAAADADVDDLLRLIASAEDELASRHRTQAVVLITDMKSFSAMTEELGSMESAKLVQRHRDLLLPVIERHGGKGKSTGGDGLVAAFADAGAALTAAIDIQRTLDDFSRSERAAQEVLIRVGVAAGEVVLDKGGRPFLGSALNLAARVMDLADGGRVMATGAVAAASGLASPTLMPHGEFKLKNIAEPVTVVEVAWRDGQTPQEIRAS